MNFFKHLSVATLLALIYSTNSFAETLTIDAGGPVAPDATGVPINIIVNEGGNTAGASFTVTYDATKLDYKGVSSSFFATFAAQGIDPPTVTVGTPPDEIEYSKGMLDNPLSGAVMLAAAQATNGAAGTQTLFTLTFDVKSGATGDASINITKSTITNISAGYPTPTELDMLVGVSGATYPVVPVTAIISDTLTIGATDSDSDGIADSWEITHFGNLTTATATSDFDKDGYTDKQEYLNAGSYDPKVKNAAGGTGYNGATDNGWIMVNEASAENIIAFRDGIAADFGPNGLFYFDGTTWTKLNTVDSGTMIQANIDLDADMELVVYFPGFGLYTWDGVWTQINNVQPEEMVPFGNKIAIDFGSSYGLYLYDTVNQFVQINSADPSMLTVADIDLDNVLELAVHFSEYGLFIWDDGWYQINTLQPQDMVSYGNSLAINFGESYGLFSYSLANGYVQLSPAPPSQLAAADVNNDGKAELAAIFPGSGLFIWDGAWSQINTVEPEHMIPFGNSLAIDFGSFGLYTFTAQSGYVTNANQNPSLMVANQNVLFCKFISGIFSFSNKSDSRLPNTLVMNLPTDGLCLYNDTNLIHQINPAQSTMAISVDFNNDNNSEIVAYFPGYGLYVWDGFWTQINSVQPEKMVPFGNKIAIDFGSSYGLYLYDTVNQFVQINTADPSMLTVADIDSDNVLELTVLFSGNGLFTWDDGWYQISTLQPQAMIAYGNSLAINFGGSFGLWSYNVGTGYVQLTPGSSSHLATADVDGDGNDELAAFFPGYGLYIWDGSWSQINTVEPQDMISFGNTLAINFGSLYGLYIYSASTGFLHLTPTASSHLAVADINNDGNLELAVAFPGYGVLIWDGSKWLTEITSQQPNFITPLHN